MYLHDDKDRFLNVLENMVLDLLKKIIYIGICRAIGNMCEVLPQWTETKGEWSCLSGQTQKVRGPALVDSIIRLQLPFGGCNFFH